MSWNLKEAQQISQARLLLAAPEYVYEQVQYYGQSSGIYNKPALEKILRDRDNKIINLALAQYGKDNGIVFELYQTGDVPANGTADDDYNKALRIACLSNQNLDYFGWKQFDFKALLEKGLTSELYVLLKNPATPTSLFEKLYRKSDFFAGLEDANWLYLIRESASDRLSVNKSNRDFPDFSSMGMQRAIFEFLETVAVTKESAETAHELLNNIDQEQAHTVEKDIKHILERWREVEIKGHGDKERAGYYTQLSFKEELACLIGILYGRRPYNSSKHVPSGSDQDIALRCAHYATAVMSEKEMQAAFNKDTEAFVFAALHNKDLYFKKGKRALFESFLFSDFSMRNYLYRCRKIHQSQQWFDPTPITNHLLIEVGHQLDDVKIIRAKIDTVTTKIKDVEGMISLILGFGILVILRRLMAGMLPPAIVDYVFGAIALIVWSTRKMIFKSAYFRQMID